VRRQVSDHVSDRLSLALNATYPDEMGEVGRYAALQKRADCRHDAAYMANLVAPALTCSMSISAVTRTGAAASARPYAPRLLSAARQDRQGLFGPRRYQSEAGFDVPVVAVGKLGYPDLAERALRQGLCDMIMLARPLLADPDWPRKAFAGRVAEIRPCIGDQEGCINEFIHGVIFSVL